MDFRTAADPFVIHSKFTKTRFSWRTMSEIVGVIVTFAALSYYKHIGLFALILVLFVIGRLFRFQFVSSNFFFMLNPESKQEEKSSPFHHRIISTIAKFLPIIWTSHPKLRIYFLICLILLAVGRIMNLYVPWLNKSVVDSLTNTSEPFQWNLIVLTVLIGFCHKLMDILHSILWFSIEQNNALCVQLKYFSHLHALDHSWHVKNNKGDLFSIAELGSTGLNDVLEHLLFSILPTFLDILITLVYLSTVFNGWVGMIVISQVILYLTVTVLLMEWKKGFHRSMNAEYVKQHEFAVDSLLNFETVKYFTNEAYEEQQMKRYINRFQHEECKVTLVGKVMDLAQMIVITIGLLITSLICGWLVYHQNVTIGDYFLFFSYFGQLHGLLKYFGSYYRSMSRSLVNMEALIKILVEKPRISNMTSNSKDLVLEPFKGHIEFRHVTFGYYNPDTPVLKDVSFEIKPGEFIAVVGPSGEGKSTIMKLLFRFYEPWSGQILLDGNDIRKIPLKTLRNFIGIVPQDTILFNDSLRKNILYGNVNASEAEMIQAAKFACIHDKCTRFSDQYETQVGERGLCLSGGEKLRITIARMVLKNSSIYLFDEVTSSLDSCTEKLILEQLQSLSAGKTRLVISHNLASVVNCCRILVLLDGKIVETGSHETLLCQNGVYTKLWRQQQLECFEEPKNDSSTEELSHIKSRRTYQSNCKDQIRGGF